MLRPLPSHRPKWQILLPVLPLTYTKIIYANDDIFMKISSMDTKCLTKIRHHKTQDKSCYYHHYY